MFHPLQKFILSALFLFTCLLSSCKTTDPKPITEDLREYRGASFSILLPATIKVTNQQKTESAIHYFQISNSKSFLGIYEGQRPNLFAAKEKDLTPMKKRTTKRGNILNGDDVWGVDSNGKIYRESVWNCTRSIISTEGKKYRLPSMIHLWYFGTTEEEQLLLDSLVDTIEMLE